MHASALKQRVIDEIERNRAELVAVAHEIHSHPETGGREVRAADLLCRTLEGSGFSLERPLAGMPTAFRASIGHPEAPAVAFLAEYDALPGLGHACGHNLMAAMALGAALGVRSVIGQVSGRAVVIGTPDEEDAGGKIPLASAGIFNGLLGAMVVHPAVRNQTSMNALAAVGFTVRFKGRPAHAAAEPHKGINALDALILSYNGINALRQHLRDDARVHGIISNGGAAPNIVPDFAEGRFIVRARDRAYLDEIRQKISDCFQAGALATGAELSIEWQDVFDDMRTNSELARAFGANLSALGRDVIEPGEGEGLGSTDMGNVSYSAPSIHPTVSIAPRHVAGHTPEFAAAADSPAGHDAMIDGAKAMAMTAVDLWADSGLRARVAAEFRDFGNARE